MTTQQSPMQPPPRSYDLVPIPPVTGSWQEFTSFAHTYNAYTHLGGDVETLREMAYEPVAREKARGGAGFSNRIGIGIGILRAALFHLARADRFAGETDFGSRDEERLYRAIIAELHRRGDGLLPWCGETPVRAPVEVRDHHFRVLAGSFAEAIRVKGNALSRTELTKKQAARLRESMLDDLKKCSDVTIPAARAVRVSAAAAAEATRRGIDLLAQTWHTQPRFDPGRAAFHWEHTTPLGAPRPGSRVPGGRDRAGAQLTRAQEQLIQPPLRRADRSSA